ncbi:MAG: CHAT domain-containing protein [Myxococcales bacterium]|nr:CHAT domain-containing protein [Myxococcales bacterium]
MKRIAVCFAPVDKRYLERLEDQLKPLAQRGTIGFWHSAKIEIGAEVAKVRRENIERADVIVLLISADFLADFDDLLKLALAQQLRGAVIVPVMLRATFLADEQLLAMARLPADGKPLSPRKDEDQAWVDVVQAIMAKVSGSSSQDKGPKEHDAIPKDDRASVLKLLFLGAVPTNAARLQIDREAREIERRINAAPHRDRIKLETQWAVTAEELSQLLLRHRPNILHFSGHGTPDGRIVLNDAQGNGYPVPREALAKLFAMFGKRGLRCVVLSACFAEEQAQAIAEHIDCVVGVSGAIADESAQSFAAGLYSALAAGETVEEAFSFGCIQISLMNQTGADAPRLICKKGVDAAQVRLV